LFGESAASGRWIPHSSDLGREIEGWCDEFWPDC
jgi:hypothetical protein